MLTNTLFGLKLINPFCFLLALPSRAVFASACSQKALIKSHYGNPLDFLERVEKLDLEKRVDLIPLDLTRQFS